MFSEMKSLLYSVVILIAMISLTHGRQQPDVQAEINKITEKFEKLEKPSPQMIESFLQQVNSSCRTHRTIDPDAMGNMTACAGKEFNQTALAIEFQEAIPKGDLDDVFRSICLKWPIVKSCFKGGFDLIEECWEEGNRINVALDAMVAFFCEQDNSGARIALFFAEGGLTCLETHGDAVRSCVNEYFGEDNQEICASVGQIHQCLTPLRKCKDVTPENLISSMVRQVGKSLNCPPLIDPYVDGRTSNDNIAIASSRLIIFASTFLLGVTTFVLAK
jgi:hypothetical protein